MPNYMNNNENRAKLQVKARKKQYEVGESGRKAVTLDKRQLKELKKISVEFEMPDKDILKLAVDVLIHKYQRLSTNELDEFGIKVLFD
ncbi:MAG: hypothetical protein GY874_00655 [Desulfobacteraceae bacterium]|nr:hypothetical protein [Desulfobacteraceae bacterium]